MKEQELITSISLKQYAEESYLNYAMSPKIVFNNPLDPSLNILTSLSFKDLLNLTLPLSDYLATSSI